MFIIKSICFPISSDGGEIESEATFIDEDNGQLKEVRLRPHAIKKASGVYLLENNRISAPMVFAEITGKKLEKWVSGDKVLMEL